MTGFVLSMRGVEPLSVFSQWEVVSVGEGEMRGGWKMRIFVSSVFWQIIVTRDGRWRTEGRGVELEGAKHKLHP